MLRTIGLIVWALGLVACAGPLPKEAKSRPGLDYAALLAAPSRPVSDVRKRVIDTATALLGTPYKFGGTTPKGFDCTGYVGYVFNKAAGLSLPRTSMEQIQAGEPLPSTGLQPGDLVYFRIGRKKDLHLGIYAATDASSTHPVQGARLTCRVWNRNTGARASLARVGSWKPSAGTRP
jgi:cell wall-associated NlpC family hydrolase